MLGYRQLFDQGFGRLGIIQHARDHSVSEIHVDLRAALHGDSGRHGLILCLHIRAVSRNSLHFILLRLLRASFPVASAGRHGCSRSILAVSGDRRDFAVLRPGGTFTVLRGLCVFTAPRGTGACVAAAAPTGRQGKTQHRCQQSHRQFLNQQFLSHSSSSITCVPNLPDNHAGPAFLSASRLLSCFLFSVICYLLPIVIVTSPFPSRFFISSADWSVMCPSLV